MGGERTNQVAVTNILDFLSISLYIAITSELNKWISWFTPGGLLSRVGFCGASAASPCDLP